MPRLNPVHRGKPDDRVHRHLSPIGNAPENGREGGCGQLCRCDTPTDVIPRIACDTQAYYCVKLGATRTDMSKGRNPDKGGKMAVRADSAPCLPTPCSFVCDILAQKSRPDEKPCVVTPAARGGRVLVNVLPPARRPEEIPLV